MPQMALEALSENWFFKELGDIHWELICNGLNTKSFDLKNDTEDRLYATFVRIRMSCSKNLSVFKENKEATIAGSINRFGNSMYFSEIQFESEGDTIKAELMTTFSIRSATDNTKLAKSEPHGVKNEVERLTGLPKFGSEYRLVKKQVLKELIFGDYKFEIDDSRKAVFQTTYELNPFYDLNGVNLLYFAAYPIINDYCEARYFKDILTEERWEQTYYTSYKDVLYYANCNIEDRIVYKMMSNERLADGSYQISSILERESDGVIIARIFTVKSRI